MGEVLFLPELLLVRMLRRIILGTLYYKHKNTIGGHTT